MRISLSKATEQLVKELLKRGSYKSADEAVEAGLAIVRDLQESEDARLAWLREAVRIGEESGKKEGWIRADKAFFESIKKDGRRLAAAQRRKRA